MEERRKRKNRRGRIKKNMPGGLWWESQKERDNKEILGVGGKPILGRISEKWN
jgi:hypothetical protein